MPLLTDLDGEKIRTILTHALGNGASIGGLKVMAESGWFGELDVSGYCLIWTTHISRMILKKVRRDRSLLCPAGNDVTIVCIKLS